MRDAFFLRKKKRTAPAIARTPRTAPTAMPDFAPALRPLFVVDGEEVLVAAEFVDVVVVMEEDDGRSVDDLVAVEDEELELLVDLVRETRLSTMNRPSPALQHVALFVPQQ